MKFHSMPVAEGRMAPQLWVMLPGAYMKPADFLAAGFVDALRQRNLPCDVALLEATVPDIAEGSALLYLREFLQSQAAVRSGPVGLLGISLGAHLALCLLAQAAREPGASVPVARACLLAPYLGPREIAAEVAATGALALWRPLPSSLDDTDRQIWHWLQQRPAGGCDLYLGYGREDRFARAHALMAQALPTGRVDVQPGGHDWPVWSLLWNRYLDRMHEHR